MCLIACAVGVHPDFPLIVAANRDEFHARPTAAAAPWAGAPQVIGGRDLAAGGSWMAVSGHQRLAAVTNVRRMTEPDPAAPSRGALVANFVTATQPATAFVDALLPDAHRYAGFNLLLWEGGTLHYVGNWPTPIHRVLTPGVYGVSNAALDTPWPKLQQLRRAMAQVVAQRGPPDALFTVLSDRTPAADAELPDTGAGIELERFLSPPFISDARYGTRASTLVTVDAAGCTRLEERRFGPNGKPDGISRLKTGP
jgi:uncharacterized protein with NRDE domain